MPTSQKGFAPIILILGIILVSAGIVGGSYYYKNNIYQKEKINEQPIARSSALNNTKPKETTDSAQNPKIVVNEFFKAAQNRDRIKARNLLSPNVVKEAFKSTFDEQSSSPSASLYTQKFEYNIIEGWTNTDDTKAFIKVNLIIEGQTFPTMVVLEKDMDGPWLIVYNESVSYSDSEPPAAFERVNPDQNTPRIVSVIIEGPADLFITNPEGNHSGIDPKTNTLVNEITGATYLPRSEIRKPFSRKSASIRRLVGYWVVEVVGSDSGKYQLVIDPFTETDQSKVLEGDVSRGSKEDYILYWPIESTKPFEITKVKQIF